MSKTYTGHLSQKRLNAMFHATKRTKLGRQVNKFLKEHSGGRFGAQPELPLVVIRDAAVPVSLAPERLKAFIRAVFASIRRRVVSSAWPRSRLVMAITKCRILWWPVSRITAAASALSQCGRARRLDGPLAGIDGDDDEYQRHFVRRRRNERARTDDRQTRCC
jgi:hypothetical protein